MLAFRTLACWTNIYITMAACAVEMLLYLVVIQKILTRGQTRRNSNIK